MQVPLEDHKLKLTPPPLKVRRWNWRELAVNMAIVLVCAGIMGLFWWMTVVWIGGR